MKKVEAETEEDGLRPEYDLSKLKGRVRGKYAERYNDAAQADSTVGDVETAGETTAAAAIKGPTDTSAVGADTMVKVADSSERGQAHLPDLKDKED